MKEICTLSITPTEEEVLSDLINYCSSKSDCENCPLKPVCDRYLNEASMYELMSVLLTKVKIEEE